MKNPGLEKSGLGCDESGAAGKRLAATAEEERGGQGLGNPQSQDGGLDWETRTGKKKEKQQQDSAEEAYLDRQRRPDHRGVQRGRKKGAKSHQKF
jgi:hypothetical protein